MKTRSIRQVVNFSASPHDLYEIIMDSKKHAAFSGEGAKMSRVIGGKFSAYGGWVRGTNLKLVPGRLIVQAWRGEDWPEGHYSKATFLFSKTKIGTKLTFSQTGVPAELYADINTGWKSEYWEKMKAVLGKKKSGQKSTAT
jgi:activator of HSP90 ATPase